MEFEFIKRIRQKFPQFLGDDCAVLSPPKGQKLLLTADELVENVHFRRSYFSLSDVGYKAVSAACSDVAAMGGKVAGILISLSLPKDFSASEIDDIYDGVETFCRPLDIAILGGNIAASSSGLHIVTSVLGFCRRPILRSGAKPRDKIFVTGTLGGALAGFMMLSGKAKPKLPALTRDLLSVRHRRPRSRIEAGELLGEFNISAMIDISDGFFADLSHIADESGVGFSIQLEKLPLFPGVDEVSRAMKIHPSILAARSGEEFELLFTAPTEIGEKAVMALKEELDIPTTVVGKIMKSSRKITLDGEKISPDELAGWRHLA